MLKGFGTHGGAVTTYQSSPISTETFVSPYSTLVKNEISRAGNEREPPIELVIIRRICGRR